MGRGRPNRVFLSERLTFKEISMGRPNRVLLSDSRSKKFPWDGQTEFCWANCSLKFSWDGQTEFRWVTRGQRNFHGTAKPSFAERLAVKEIFMGRPNRVSLSDSRSKKFPWDSQTVFRWAIHGYLGQISKNLGLRQIFGKFSTHFFLIPGLWSEV